MANNVHDLIAELEVFQPASDGECVGPLYALLEDFESIEHRELAVSAMLGVIERFPTADLGSPGPLVHAIESTTDYRPLLHRSFDARPAALTAWMINRILNAHVATTERARWLALLGDVAGREGAPDSARREAAGFLAFQQGRS